MRIASAEASGTPVVLQLSPAHGVGSGSLDLTVGNGTLAGAEPITLGAAVGAISAVYGAFQLGYEIGALVGPAEAWALGMIFAASIADELRKLWP